MQRFFHKNYLDSFEHFKINRPTSLVAVTEFFYAFADVKTINYRKTLASIRRNIKS